MLCISCHFLQWLHNVRFRRRLHTLSFAKVHIINKE